MLLAKRLLMKFGMAAFFWFGILGFFVPFFYALIPNEKINKLGARNNHKCIFLAYSNTTKVYCFYDEVIKKFVISKYVIFLESFKNDNFV